MEKLDYLKKIKDGEVKRPCNVIWIFGDQHRGQAMGCMGDPNALTPNLDRMAVEGLHFTHAISGAPTCTPFRGSLLTSRHAHECAPENGDPLPQGIPTISTTLRENGYQTCYLGKWHLAGEKNREGGWRKLVPEWQRKDWDEWIGYDNYNAQWDCWIHSGFGENLSCQRLEGYETDVLTDMQIERINKWGKEQKENENAKPFFSVLSVQPPHDPSVASQEWMEKFKPGAMTKRPNVPDIDWVNSFYNKQIGGYYAQVANLDHNVGRIRQALYENNLEHNTIIFYFSDHGSMLGSHGRFNKSVPYEESIRIPMIIYGGRKRIIQLSTDALINHVDIAPTTLGMCGIQKPDYMRGFDYSGLYTQKKVDDSPTSAILQECGGFSTISPKGWRAIVTRDGWKYAVTGESTWLLFNLNQDPYEMCNLVFISHYYEKRRELHELLTQKLKEIDDPFAMPTLEW